MKVLKTILLILGTLFCFLAFIFLITGIIYSDTFDAAIIFVPLVLLVPGICLIYYGVKKPKRKKSDYITANFNENIEETISNHQFSTKLVFSNDNINSSEIPPLQGDYAKTVFLNAYSTPSPIKQRNEYQSYLLYECGIQDPVSYHHSLIDEGYLGEASQTDILKSLKISDLKTMLSELGQPVSGRKDTLVNRVLSTADDAFLRLHCPTNDMYCITEKGAAFLHEHYDYIKLRKNNVGLTWQEYDSMKKPGYHYNDIMWGFLNRQALRTNGQNRNIFYEMYLILKEEEKNSKDGKNRPKALEMLLHVLYIDISGIDAIIYIELYQSGQITLQEAKKSFDAFVFIAPKIIKEIIQYKDIYNEDLVNYIVNFLYNKWKLPLQICSKKLFLSIVHSIFDDTYNETDILKKLKASYNSVLHSVHQSK